MSNFNIVLHNGKYRLHFQGFAYCYSNPIGIVGSHWGCIVAACPAHVKINKAKDTIIGGDFTHNHESSDTTTTKPSSPRSPKTTSSFSTPPKTKPISKKSDLQNGTPFSTPKGPSKSSEDAVDSNDILNISYKEQRDAAIDTIMTKENELETFKKELSESKDLIESLKASISAIEAGWEVDRAELKELRSELSKFRSESKIKLTVIGDSHVKFLEDGLSKLFPAYFDIKCLAKSGATMEDFGFRSGLSTTDAILKLLDYISICFEEKTYACTQLCDVSRAFDTLCHDLLIEKLRKYHFHVNSLKFFKSYLSNRTQCVRMVTRNVSPNANGSTSVSPSSVSPSSGSNMQPISPHGAGVKSCQLSAFSPLEAGVPQGSILGPLLFLIYINDLPRYMEGEETVLFADDSTISQKIKNLPECGTYFSSSHNKIEHWFSANHLYLNNDKTEEVIFSLRDMGNFNNPEGKIIF
ncbi:hypothetical protein M8J75_015834 [Diaphorina citri]|nr:hypothetical protein M8J75_015834 [Diaphorina citri]